MTRLFMALATALVAVIIAAAQGELTGKWEGSTPNGARLQLDLIAKDTALTGTLTRNDVKVAITDGKIEKTTFSFKATLNDQAEGFSGEIKGDTLRLWLDRQGPDNGITLTRVKP